MRPASAIAAVAVALAALHTLFRPTSPDVTNPAAVPAGETAASTTETTLDSLLVAGEAIYWTGEVEAAEAVFERALEEARGESAIAAEAAAMTWLGLAAWRLGDPVRARELGEAALKLKLRHGLTADLARSYNALGLLAWTQGRLIEAADLFARTTEAAEASGDLTTAAKAANNLALVHADMGDFHRARESYRQSLAAARAIGDTLILGRVLNNLGTLETRVGEPTTGISLLEQARQLYRASGDRTGEQHTLSQLGVTYAALDRPRLAFAVLDSSLSMARASGLLQEEGITQALLGELYRQAGDHKRALDFYRRALEIDEELELDIERGADLRSVAEIHLALESHEAARDHAERALAVHDSAGARVEALADRLLLAWIHQVRGDPPAARRELAEARTLATALGTRSARIGLALAEARVAEQAGNPRLVLQILEAQHTALSGGTYRDLAEAEWLRSRALRDLERLEEAADAGQRSIAALERIREGFATGALRTAFAFEKRVVYADLVQILVELGDVRAAFEIADAARGRSLGERLATDARLVAAAGPAIEREDLLRTIDELEVRIDELDALSPEDADASVAATREALAAKLVEARRRFEELHVRRSEARAADALLGATGVSAAEILAALEPGETLVAYFLAPDRLHAFIADRNKVRAVTTPIDPRELAAQVRMAREIVGRPGSRAPGLLTRLHEQLIAPLQDEIGEGRLILVLDGPLVDLPFSALRSPSGSFLVQEHSLLHLPSAAALPALRGRRTAARSRSTIPVQVLVPFPDELPSTALEARSVKRALGRVTLVDGQDATEARSRQALGMDALVHIASHGSLEATSPLFSRVRFARGTGVPQDDGRLEVHELLGISMQSPLVFLSGCETGAGSAWTTLYDRGEDFTTLARAFLHAGARNVVATLWPIEDGGAATFAERFYRHLLTVDPVEALARAQRETIDDLVYGAPFYWGAYRAVGEGSGLGAHIEPRIPFIKRWWYRLRDLTERSAP